MGMLLNYVLEDSSITTTTKTRVELCGALSIRDACAHQDLTFYCGQQKKNEFLGLNLCTTIHFTERSRTLFAARAACAESHSGLKSVFMLAKKILSEMSIFHFESNLKKFGFS